MKEKFADRGLDEGVIIIKEQYEEIDGKHILIEFWKDRSVTALSGILLEKEFEGKDNTEVLNEYFSLINYEKKENATISRRNGFIYISYEFRVID